MTPNRTAIIILGMHRSGTSAMTRIINLLGADLPSKLMPPTKAGGDNEKGFWESLKLTQLNDLILESVDSSWDDWRQIDPNWLNSPVKKAFEYYALEILERDFSQSSVFVLKDPRFCRLLPFWLEVLNKFDVEPKCVLPIRDPREVSESLRTRNGFSSEQSQLLWLRHVLDAEKQTRHLKRVFVSFSHLLDNWRSTATQIANNLDLELPPFSSTLEDEIDQFLDPKLRHHVSDQNGDSSRIEWMPWIKQTYQILIEMRDNPNSKTEEIKLDQIYFEFNRSAGVFGSLLFEQKKKIACHEEKIASLSNQIKELTIIISEREAHIQKCEEITSQQETHMKELGDIISEREAHIQKCEEITSQQETHMKELGEIISQRETRIGELQDKILLEAQYKQEALSIKNKLLHHLNTIHDSISWKLSKPLRYLDTHLPRFMSAIAAIIKLVYWTLSLQLFDRLQLRKSAKYLLSSGLFDYHWYVEQNPDVVLEGNDIVIHWLTDGWLQRRDPHPLFDTNWYLTQYPDVAEVGINPLLHYLEIGAKEGRCPNPLFDTNWYLTQYPDVAEAGINPLLHYIKVGVQEGRNPNSLFDTNWYLTQHPDAAKAGINPLLHYLKNGATGTTSPYFVPLKSADLSSILDKTELKLSLQEEAQQISFPGYKNPDVTIVVPVYNQLGYTLRCLKGLMYQKTENLTFQVIVADDTSSDKTPDIIPLITGLDYIRNPENYGFLRSCNNASQQAKGKYLVFLNNDTVPLENWLQELIQPFLNDDQDKIGLVGSMLLYPNGMLQEAGGLIWNDGSGWNFGRMQEPNRCEYNYIRETDYCSGASIALTTKLWQQLNGFDPLFIPAYYEDTDIAFRVRQAGYKVIFNPFSRIIHFEGISSGTDTSSGVKHYQEVNKPKFLERWHDILMTYPAPPQSLETANYHRQIHHRLLWIDAVTPTPDQDSGSADVINYFKVIQKSGWGITFIPDNLFYDDHYTQKLQKMGVECIYPPYWRSVEDYLKHHGTEFEVIVLCRAYIAAGYVELVRRYAPQAKIIFNTVDLHFLRQTRKVDTLRQVEFIDEAATTFSKEMSAIYQSDLTIVISETEKSLVRSLAPSANVETIPILREIPGSNAKFEDRKDIGFIGGFRHPPNVDAVHYFVSSVFPLILEKIPDCRFVVAGSHIPDEIANLASDNIIVRGFVPDIKDFFESIRISVAPLRFGAGMKGKVVSSLSHGVPVVATSIATEGMEMVNQQEGMICDQPEAMAQAIIDCYTSPTLWNRLSINGLELATTNFSVEVIGAKIKTILDGLINND